MRIRKTGSAHSKSLSFDEDLFARQLQDTFNHLHASPTTYEEVMMKINGAPSTKTTVLRTAGIAIAGTLACAGTAFAIVSGSEFFASAFGDKGQESVEVHTIKYDYKPGSFTVPSFEWAGVSEETAQSLVGNESQEVGFVITHGDLTVTVNDVVTDQNGLGVATLTLSDPNGFEGMRQSTDYGEIVFYDPSPLRSISVYSGTDLFEDRFSMRNSALILDNNLSSETELHVVMYFQPMFREYAQSPLIWCVQGVDQDGQWSEFSDVFEPQVQANTISLAAGNYTASVSPLGIVFDGPIGEQAQSLVIDHKPQGKLVFIMDDGTTWKFLGDYDAAVQQGEDGNIESITFTYCGNVDPEVGTNVEVLPANENAAGEKDLIAFNRSDLATGLYRPSQYEMEITETGADGFAKTIVFTNLEGLEQQEVPDYRDPAVMEAIVVQTHQIEDRFVAAVGAVPGYAAPNNREKFFFDDGSTYVVEGVFGGMTYGSSGGSELPQTDADLLGIMGYNSTDPEPTWDDFEAREQKRVERLAQSWGIDSIVIDYADGSQYVVKGENTQNWIKSVWTDDDGLSYLFNRLIDPTAVTSITIPGPDGNPLIYVPTA